jgi:hypothetical protein
MRWIFWIFHQYFRCRRWFYKDSKPYVKKGVHKDSLPWFWLGAVYTDNDPTDVTDVINKSLTYGTHVTHEYLRIVSGLDGAVWKYIDSKTLEEKDFPSEGFIIENVVDNSISHSE